QGRSSHTLLTKVQTGRPLTDQEREQYRSYQREHNNLTYTKRNETIDGRARTLFRGAKKRARNNNLAFDLTEEWIIDRLKAGVCERTGIRFDLTKATNSRTNKFAPSIDKVNPKGSYTKDNCRLVVWMFNQAKADYSDEDLLLFANLVFK